MSCSELVCALVCLLLAHCVCLGFVILDAPDDRGLKIKRVKKGLAAWTAGLLPGDIVVQVGQTVTPNRAAFNQIVYTMKPGDIVPFIVERHNSRLNIKVEVGARVAQPNVGFTLEPTPVPLPALTAPASPSAAPASASATPPSPLAAPMASPASAPPALTPSASPAAASTPTAAASPGPAATTTPTASGAASAVAQPPVFRPGTPEARRFMRSSGSFGSANSPMLSARSLSPLPPPLISGIPVLTALPGTPRRLGGGGFAFPPSPKTAISEPTGEGVKLATLEEGGPAEAAGLQVGDVIERVDDHVVRTETEFLRILHKLTPKQVIQLTVVRNGTKTIIPMTVGARLSKHA